MLASSLIGLRASIEEGVAYCIDFKIDLVEV